MTRSLEPCLALLRFRRLKSGRGILVVFRDPVHGLMSLAKLNPLLVQMHRLPGIAALLWLVWKKRLLSKLSFYQTGFVELSVSPSCLA